MSYGRKIWVLLGLGLIILSLVSLLYFLSVSALSLFTWSTPSHWKECFALCSIAYAGWMILYSCQLWLGGGVIMFRSNLLLLWSLFLAVLISVVVRFHGPQRYGAILVLGAVVVLFNVVVPGLTSPRMLVRMLQKKNGS